MWRRGVRWYDSHAGAEQKKPEKPSQARLSTTSGRQEPRHTIIPTTSEIRIRLALRRRLEVALAAVGGQGVDFVAEFGPVVVGRCWVREAGVLG